MKDKKVYILIPAYNEDKVIVDTINKIKAEGYNNIIVVDDGSTDNTYLKLQGTNVETIKHMINRGQGASLRTGIEYICEIYDFDVIVTFDADGQHDPRDIKKIIRPILKNSADIVLGSRFLDERTKVPFVRKMILKAGVFFTNIISNIQLTDTHNGLRALGKKAAYSIKISHRGMEHASDIINEIAKHDLKYAEIPVKIVYTEYSVEKGQASFGFIKMGLKIIFNKILK